MAGTLVVISDSIGDVDTSDQLMIFEAYQKALIVNGENLKVADFINTRLATADIVAAASDTFPLHGTSLFGATTSAAMVADYVTAADGSAYVYGYVTTSQPFLSTEVVTGTNPIDSTTISFTINAEPVAHPHWYDWEPYPGGTFGEMPEKAYLGCLYRGRAVLSGNPKFPHQWWMSRQANIWDWAFLATDALSPISGANSDAGELGDIVRCLIPCGDDYLVFGCASQVWLLRGDPAAGGTLDKLSGATGIFGPLSWCWDSQRNLYFWGSQGIYRMSPEFGIENLTQDKLPDLIKDEGANPSTHRITLGFDQIRQGIVVSVVELDSGSNSCYWYDIRTGGFFPEVYPTQCGAYCQYYYNANAASLADLLIGCKDGYIRSFKDAATMDDTGSTETAIESRMFAGPALTARDADSRGRMKSLSITLGADTDSVDYEVYAEDTAEEVVDAILSSPLHAGTITGGNRTQTLRPRSRGAWMGILLRNDNDNETWSFEQAVAEIKAAGKI